MPADWLEVLSEEMRTLGADYRPNELAFLALTSKIEGSVRDKLAFRLHGKYGSRARVTREWKRVDLAVLDGAHPSLLLQLKALYAWDLTKVHSNPDLYPSAIAEDFVKAGTRGFSGSTLGGLIVCTHPRTRIGVSAIDDVKYGRQVNRALDIYGTPEGVLAAADQHLVEALKARGQSARLGGVLSAGSCWGIDVDIPYWTVQ